MNHGFLITKAANCKIVGKWDEVLSDSYLTLISERNLEKNEELLISYGEMTNHELLSKYGFIETDNPYS